MSKIVKKTSGPITPAQRRRLAKLAEMPDECIDFSGIPPLTEEFWQRAIRSPWYRPVKQQITLWLDADIISWLKQQGKGYQTRANALLREAIMRDFSSRSRPENPGKR